MHLSPSLPPSLPPSFPPSLPPSLLPSPPSILNAVIMDIASLVFGYDMKRLNDITAFRRYWYRTSLVEALFIGSKQSPESAADERQFEVWSPSTSEDSNPGKYTHVAEVCIRVHVSIDYPSVNEMIVCDGVFFIF